MEFGNYKVLDCATRFVIKEGDRKLSVIIDGEDNDASIQLSEHGRILYTLDHANPEQLARCIVWCNKEEYAL